MTLQQIKYVITISETGSLNRAAETLYLAQPSLSNAIRELESELGITIFNRSGKGVTLTNDGEEFLMYARQTYAQYETMLEKYGKSGNRKKKFGVSTQHFTFAVKAFVEMVKSFDTTKYEFALRETKTRDVIDDVRNMRSEVGVLYLSDFNRRAILKLLHANNLEYFKLVDCHPYVYIRKNHPLSKNNSITLEQLADYPCLSFEQGENSSFYLSEELLSTYEYPRTIKVCDRATVLNLMVGLDAYTLCSGIICEELNGDDFIAVPLDAGNIDQESIMEVGYILTKSSSVSRMAQLYIDEMKSYLSAQIQTR